jgi:hypothetical protein
LIAFWAALGLAAGYVLVLLIRPRWTLSAKHQTPSPWLRETAWLYAAPVAGLITAAALAPSRATAIGGIVTVVVSAVIDFKRVSLAGMAFDLLVFALLVIAVTTIPA